MDSAKAAAVLLKTALKLIEEGNVVPDNIRKPYMEAAHMMVTEGRALLLAAQDQKPSRVQAVS